MAVSANMNAGRRRVIYGLNVAVATLLMIALVVIVVYLAGAYGKQLDVTRAGLNSLSPRTVQLLKGLDQTVTITGLYPIVPESVRKYSEKRYQRVADLLDLYETAAGGKVVVHMIDPEKNRSAVNELLKRLRDKPAYKEESKPHAEALGRFDEVNKQLVTLLQEESSALEGLLQTAPTLADLQPIAIIRRNFRVLLQNAQDTQAQIREYLERPLPRYGDAVNAVKSYLAELTKVLDDTANWMGENGVGLPDLPPDAQAFFAGAKERYSVALGDARDLLKQVEDLKPPALDDLARELERDQTIVVETPEKAEVLSVDDVWPWRTDQNAPEPPDGDPRDFAGEQAISSAILKLTQKDKTAIVFTRFGGEPLLKPDFSMANPMQMPQAPYQAINRVLEKENFITREWDVKTQPEPPEVEGASRVVYVVFPPAPPRRDNPMRPPSEPPISEEQKQRIIDAVEKSGRAIFLAHWEPPASQFIPVPGSYAFKDYLKKTWGIEVQDRFLTLQFAPNPQTEGLMFPISRNLIITSRAFRFTDHPISKPLKGLPAAFQAVVPLKLVEGDDKPADVHIEPVVMVDKTEDVWAISDLSRINQDLRKHQGTRRYPDDVAPPFPLGLACTRGEGDKEQKLVVYASDRFFADDLMNTSNLFLIGGALQLVKMYPANQDLFLNSVYWLTGDADRIAVGPRRGDVPRLDKLRDDGTLAFVRALLVGIWPASALVVGAVVWMVRRR